MNILGLHKDPWHNSGAAALRVDDRGLEICSLTEERLNREKNSRAFPELSVLACMEHLGIQSIRDFDLVVLDYICNGADWRKDSYRRSCTTDNLLAQVDPSKIRVMNHHLAHACAVFYSSQFDSAAVLIIDGRGSDRETQSLFRASLEDGIELIDRTDVIGVGLMYAALTQAIGFNLMEEGKTMGLAPYGVDVPGPVLDFPRKYDGIATDFSAICVDDSYDLKVELPELDDRARARLAYDTQEACESACLHLAAYARERTGESNLCISGGVGLNSVANYKILMSGIFDDIFINPAASDTGIPLGAALHGYHHLMGAPKDYPSISPFVGPSYDSTRVEKAIASFEGFRVIDEHAFEKAAERLARNQIVAVFQGRSEMGPRALGNRSILMSPLVAENKEVLNARVKFRESFRPFAPAILEGHLEEYFVLDRASPHMLLIADVVPEKRSEIPAVTHVDGTGRLQTVSRAFNPRFYDLIDEFHRATGTPVLLNTSFNVAGEPIVETPEDAIRCFLGTDIDALLIENRLLFKG